VRALAADGLRLEPQVATHAAELYPVLADPALYVFTDDKGPTDEAALTGRLRHLESRRSPDGAEQWLNWVVRTSDCGVVGYVQATVRAGSEAEIAYMLGRAFWRRGYATTACSLMLSELFQAYSVRRVTATLSVAGLMPMTASPHPISSPSRMLCSISVISRSGFCAL